jgi:hypothetical protein
MATTRKVIRKAAVEIEGTAGTYQEPNTVLPFTTLNIGKKYEHIQDESNIGYAFRDLSLQSIYEVAGNVESQVDVLTVAPLLEAMFGAESSGNYTLPDEENTKTLSLFALDAVKSNKYDGIRLNNAMLKSEAKGPLSFTADLLGETETRDATAWPTMSVVQGTRLQHRHADGTGYIRIGNQDDALGAGDNMGLASWELGVNWNFAAQYDNQAQETLTPLSGAAGRPGCSFNFVVARHTADTFLAWRDNHTALQAEIYVYASATAALKIQIPNFVVPVVNVPDEDVAPINVEAMVARNGYDTTYSNTNFSFLSPIKAILTNS